MNRRMTVLGLPTRTAAWYAALFVAALVVYPALWKGAPYRFPDTQEYIGMAQDLIHGHLDHETTRTPGYPLLLVLLSGGGHEPGRALVYASLMMHLGGIWLLGTLLCRFGASNRLLVAFCFALLTPLAVGPASTFLTEPLAEFCLVIGLWAFANFLFGGRVAWNLLAGCGFGYAALTRPSYQSVVVVFLGVVLSIGIYRKIARKAAVAAVLLITGSASVVGPYAVVSYRQLGYATPPLTGRMLAGRVLRKLERIPDEDATLREILIRWRDKSLIRRGSSHTGVAYLWEGTFPELRQATGLSVPQLDDRLRRISLRLIKDAPLEYLVQVLFAVSAYLMPYCPRGCTLDSRFVEGVTGIIHFLLISWVSLGIVAVVGALGVCYAMRRLSGNARIPSLLGEVFQPASLTWMTAILIVLYGLLVSTLVAHGDARYHAPTDIFCYFFAFSWPRAWWEWIRFFALGKAGPVPAMPEAR